MKRTWLKHIRLEINMSQKELAAELGINQNTLSRLERGIGSPRVDAEMADKLAMLSAYTAAQILEWEAGIPLTLPAPPRPKFNPHPPTKDTRRIICWWTEDGETPAEIGELLCRKPEQVAEILAECRISGEYDRYCRERRLHRAASAQKFITGGAKGERETGLSGQLGSDIIVSSKQVQ